MGGGWRIGWPWGRGQGSDRIHPINKLTNRLGAVFVCVCRLIPADTTRRVPPERDDSNPRWECDSELGTKGKMNRGTTHVGQSGSLTLYIFVYAMPTPCYLCLCFPLGTYLDIKRWHLDPSKKHKGYRKGYRHLPHSYAQSPYTGSHVGRGTAHRCCSSWTL